MKIVSSFKTGGIVVLCVAMALICWGWMKQGTVNPVGESLQEASADGNLMELNDSPTKLSRRQMIRLAKSEEQRLALLQKLVEPDSPEHLPGNGVPELFRAWFSDSPLEALEAIERIGKPGDGMGAVRLAALKEGIEAFASTPGVIDDVGVRILASDGYLRLFRLSLFPVVGKINPQEGLKMIQSLSMEDGRDVIFRAMCEVWGQDDPRSVAKAVVAMAGDNRDQFDYLSSSLYAAKPVADDIVWAKKEGLPETVVEKLAVAATRELLRKGGVDAFMEQAAVCASVPEVSREIVRTVAETDPMGFVDQFGKLRELGLVRVEDFGEVMGYLAPMDQASSERYLGKLDGFPEAQSNAAGRLSSALLRKDVNRCAEWITSLPPGPVRDAALEPMLSYLQSHNETESLKEWEALKSKANGTVKRRE